MVFGWIKSWFERTRSLEVRAKADVRFLGEQDGIPERDLKNHLIPKLRTSHVRAAYLVRVRFADNLMEEVALCISGPEDRDLVFRIASVFKTLFSEENFMNVLFLTDAEETEIEN